MTCPARNALCSFLFLCSALLCSPLLFSSLLLCSRRSVLLCSVCPLLSSSRPISASLLLLLCVFLLAGPGSGCVCRLSLTMGIVTAPCTGSPRQPLPHSASRSTSPSPSPSVDDKDADPAHMTFDELEMQHNRHFMQALKVRTPLPLRLSPLALNLSLPTPALSVDFLPQSILPSTLRSRPSARPEEAAAVAAGHPFPSRLYGSLLVNTGTEDEVEVGGVGSLGPEVGNSARRFLEICSLTTENPDIIVMRSSVHMLQLSSGR